MKELYAALVKAQAEVGKATKDRQGQVGQQKYKYADLASVDEAVDEALENNGLALSLWPGRFEEGCVFCTIELTHTSGESRSQEMSIPVAQHTAQAYGSAITYARRYATTSILRVVTEDDDGQRASTPPSQRQTPMTQAAQELGAKPVTTGQGNNSGSRPSGAATGAFNDAGPFKVVDLGHVAKSMGFRWGHIIGAYLHEATNPGDELKMANPDAGELVQFQEGNPGVTMKALIETAADWFSSVGPDGDMKDACRAWIEEHA